MCRLAAYLGTEIKLSQFLQEPEHSLIRQSWAPEEMQDGTLNADGYGVAWLSSDNTPCRYINCLPIWSDTNLDGLGHSLSSQLWLANVRSATPGQGISEANTQPFIKDKLIFTHNGCVKPFNKDIKTRLLDILSNEIRAEINGNTDSIYKFALLHPHFHGQGSLNAAINGVMKDLKNVCHNEATALLNIVMSDGELLYACRPARDRTCPSLYYSRGEENIQIASEPLTANDKWIAFPEHSLISFNSNSVNDTYSL